MVTGQHPKYSYLSVRLKAPQTSLRDDLTKAITLLVVSTLDAARNSLSFFLLLIVSLGLGVVREEIDAMNKARILAVAHACFGGTY